MCSWLKARGLHIDLLNHNGHSAVHKAAVKGNWPTCRWLLDASGGGLGRRELCADGDGNTPSLMAKLEGFTGLAQWLFAHETQEMDSLARDVGAASTI